MSEHQFDTITRRAVSGLSRRSWFHALGALGLATIAGQYSVDARNKNKNKQKKKKKAKNKAAQQANDACLADLAACTAEETRCADQVEPCTSFLTASCGGDPDCTYQAPCCTFLGTCDMSGFLACVSRSPRQPTP